jgi:hypothetical protein
MVCGDLIGFFILAERDNAILPLWIYFDYKIFTSIRRFLILERDRLFHLASIARVEG